MGNYKNPYKQVIILMWPNWYDFLVSHMLNTSEIVIIITDTHCEMTHMELLSSTETNSLEFDECLLLESWSKCEFLLMLCHHIIMCSSVLSKSIS